MRCVYMMTDENITANADKKILFWYNETEYVHGSGSPGWKKEE